MEAKALSLRLDTVPGETGAPQRSSETSSMRLMEAPARHISTMASSTLVSRLRQHSITTVWKVAPRGLGPWARPRR